MKEIKEDEQIRAKEREREKTKHREYLFEISQAIKLRSILILTALG